ncbi:MAG: sodium:proton antiporter [Ruminococcaceae bacterium]|nr:sodium:proton antiporter [Oscillospiraceae bacterium]
MLAFLQDIIKLSDTTRVLLTIGVAIIAGLLLSRLAKILKLPAVTAYLVAGILIGPFCIGLLEFPGLGFHSLEQVEGFKIFSEVALGFIAFTIGNEFRVSQLKAIGKQATVIAILQALTATILVDAALIGLHFLMPETLTLPVAVVLGAIATATAPAATLMVVRQYKAKGKLTDILLPVVALDDAVGLIVFAVSFGVAKAMQNGQFDLISIIVNPLLEIVFSLVLGFIMGALFTFLERFFSSNSKRLTIAITFVLLTVGLSMVKLEFGSVHIGFSSLLVCMMLGTVFCNLCDFSEDMMERADKWTAPLFVLFFVLNGAELDLSVFANWSIVIVGIVYIVFRSLGKYFGAYGAAKLMKCDESIVKYLGITLLPQAGVAIGMSLTAANELGETGALIRNICLFAVLVYELFGPMLTKIALIKAGDIQLKPVKLKHDHILPNHLRKGKN